MSEAPFDIAGEGEAPSLLADFFRDAQAAGDAAVDSPLLWQLTRQQALTQALSGLFHGPQALVQLRLWVFLTLASQGQALLSREQIDELFHALRPEALETALKRLRDVQLLEWDEAARAYQLPALAQRMAGLLAPLLAAPAEDEDGGELAALLGQVVGANQLGNVDAQQLQLLHAQLQRLHGAFADAIASGSEFRLRQARSRYDRAALLIDRASEAIAAIIARAQGPEGHLMLERAARGLGQAQSRLLAMASQFNRALQQADRQRVTLGTTGITSTDVKRWLQHQGALHGLLAGALARPAFAHALAPHELADVTEAEFERDRPSAPQAEALPGAQEAPPGTLAAVALPRELHDLNTLLAAWSAEDGAAGGPPAARAIADALLGPRPAATRYAQLAYKAQLMPLLGDPQAAVLPGATGALARQPWRVAWQAEAAALAHDEIALLTLGQLVPADQPLEPPHDG